jgi:hypothetical protein
MLRQSGSRVLHSLQLVARQTQRQQQGAFVEALGSSAWNTQQAR